MFVVSRVTLLLRHKTSNSGIPSCFSVQRFSLVWAAYSSSSSCSGRIRFDSCSLYPQNKIGPSISSSDVLCVFVLLVYIVVLVLASCFCPSSVRVATFPGTVLFPLLYSLLPLLPFEGILSVLMSPG